MILYIPDVLLFGFSGITITPNLTLISSDKRTDAVLHAHEAEHGQQMLLRGFMWRGKRRLGFIIFWWCYLTSKDARRDYEVGACKAGHAIDSSKTLNWAKYLANELELFGPTDTVDQRTTAIYLALIAIEEK